jgi:Icc-related predicted phosphoesterase
VSVAARLPYVTMFPVRRFRSQRRKYIKRMRLVLISDTHDMENQVTLPDGDILVHAGDLTMMGHRGDLQRSINWLNVQPHKHVVFVAGNHDFGFERDYVKKELNLGRAVYLENNWTAIDGLSFWGSPVQPWFMDWAFNVHRGAPIKKYWDMIPNSVDVLVTHGPPYGILDQSRRDRSDHLGCEELAKRIEVINPILHVFGHIHGSAGIELRGKTKFINASVVNEDYNVVNEPIVVDL